MSTRPKKATSSNMSYGRLHHDNRSSHAIVQQNRDHSPPPVKVAAYESEDEESVVEDTDNGAPQEAYELKALNSRNGPNDHSKAIFDAERSDSEEVHKPDFRRAHSDSASTTQSFMLYTPDEERTVKRKFDHRLVLLVAFLYMLSFLDRSNIGNARVAGMTEDLHLSSYQFEWLLRIFYIMYIAFEWMTLLWKVFPPHIYLAICVCSWGLIASLQSLATSFSSMLVLRALLGIGEAAFVGIPFYMSFFYKRDELALRTGLFISAAPLATSFAGTLAWLITRFGDAIPIASWRILLLIEGFPSIIVATFVYYTIPDSPEHAKYLTRREQRVARLRLRKENDVDAGGSKPGKIRLAEIRDALLDPICYLTAAMFFCCNVAFSSLPVFLPTIIEEMGYTALRSQALSAPPYLVAFFAVLLTAYLSDRYRTRSLLVIFHALLGCTGYSIMAIAGSLHASAHWRYAGAYPATTGFFSAITIIITWTLNNQESSTGRGTGLAILNYIGQLGPLLGVHLYPESDGPYYVKGMAVCAVFMLAVAVLALVLRIHLQRRNQRMAVYEKAGEEEEEEEEDDDDEGLVAETQLSRGNRFSFIV